MAALEHSVGAPLFNRTARGIALTPQGCSLMQRAEVLLQELGDMRPQPADAVVPASDFRIGMLSGIRDLLLPSLLQKLPALGLRDASMFESSMPVLREQVRKRVLDIAILGDPSVQGGLEFRPIWRERLFLVSPSSSDATSVQDLPFLMVTEDPALRVRLAGALARAGRRPRRTVTITPTDMAKQLIREGLGYSVLPYSMIGPGLSSDRFTVAPIDAPPLAIGVVYHSRPCDSRIDAFVLALEEIIRDHRDAATNDFISLA
jgi:DNA-binding transcriptional LysR family regulator